MVSNLLLEATTQTPGIEPMLIAIVVAMIVMTVMSSRAQKKERQKLNEWINNLDKNSKVVTKGGIHGTVYSVKENTVVLKIDEDKGIKMTVTKDAILGSSKDI